MVMMGMDIDVERRETSPALPCWTSLPALNHNPPSFHSSQWQHSQPGRTTTWRRRSYQPSTLKSLLFYLLLAAGTSTVQAAFINFENCLEQSIVQSNPLQLQFIPLFLSIQYDPNPGPNPLTMTVYGNVSGLAEQDPYPPPNSPDWKNPNVTVGKIQDLVESNHKYSTLFTKINVLSFNPYNNASRFCESVTQGECPLGPVFYVNASDPPQLRAFSVSHDMQNSYQFMSIIPTLRVRSGDEGDSDLACISASVTPSLSDTLRGLIAYIPLLVLVFVGAANIFAAISSPWGSTDPFHWTSNYGQDEDLLRLVTPGFGDCLQYIQFIVLTGGLSLTYPGFYQPIVSQGGWSVLMFNESFVSGRGGQNPVVDGVYVVNATNGLDNLAQYVGMKAAKDIWPGMVIWLLVILVTVSLLIQAAFAIRWIYRVLAHIPEEDLRAKNMPFTVGNVIRILFNFLLLPVVSLSMFQLVVAADSPAYSVTLAVVLIAVLIGFALWIIRLIVTTRPRAFLFDDLYTVLLYGPLYNTYGDETAGFALVPIFITFLRGIAIGALQPSGVAQLVLLAICEVVFIITVTAFRPYPSPTSMNIYQVLFALVRFIVILLSVSFIPTLGITEQVKGWIGYIILFIHALLLAFGFFLNALQTFVEVVARLLGAGGSRSGATRGGLTKVFGARQLSRRNPRSDVTSRQSLNSEAAMLANIDDRSTQYDGSRVRSLSGSSAMLLQRDGRTSVTFDMASTHGGSHSRAGSSGFYTPITPTTPAGGTGGNGPSNGTKYQPIMSNLRSSETADPYYRPPRPRKRTMETQLSLDSTQRNMEQAEIEDEAGEGSSGAMMPVYLGATREDSDLDDSRQTRKDYAVREVDFYYRVRGPALSQTGTRKLKTGPADPTGPVSSASGWFRRLLGGKTKEQGKGFEVIRSARAPPPGMRPSTDGAEYHEPYRDDSGTDSAPGHSREVSGATAPYRDSEDDAPPQLPEIDAGGAIELPSRIGSQRTTHSTTASEKPPVPRKSSRRKGSRSDGDEHFGSTLITIPGSPSSVRSPADDSERVSSMFLHPSDSQPGRLPFAGSESGSKERSLSAGSTGSSLHRVTTEEQGTYASDVRRDLPPGMGYVPHHQTSSSIHHESPGGLPNITGSTAELVEQSDLDSEGREQPNSS